MSKSTVKPRRRKSAKPDKPRPDFPLFPHATKRWAKKVRGKLHYFGPWDDPKAAEDKWLAQKDDLLAGRIPRVQADGFTVKVLCDTFRMSKLRMMETGELTKRSFDDYIASCQRICDAFGRARLVSDLTPGDFEKLRTELAKTRGPKTLGNEVNRIRSVFKYAFDNGHVPAPVRYGQGFRAPNKRTMRVHRASKGPRMFEAVQIRAMVNGAVVVGDDGPELVQAGMQIRAMILLAVNCGFGNTDVGRLPLSALDLDAGWVDFPRPKTGIARRAPLWPETVAAIREVLANRREPKDGAHAGLVFITNKRGCWAKEGSENPLTKEMGKLLRALGIAREGLNFYALRHTFETIGGESRDQVAVDHIMGHAPDNRDMASVYRERISDDRLKAVTECVRAWLFGGKEV